MRKSLLCNFKVMTETPDFPCDLIAISFSQMDAACPAEPYTRARPEGLQSAWLHKVLSIFFTTRHEKAHQCCTNPRPIVVVHT